MAGGSGGSGEPDGSGESVWITETIGEAAGLRTVLRAEGDVRHVGEGAAWSLFDNLSFGRVLMLDGAVQLTTGDEFIYHEMMAHVPLFAHGAARRVLIVGGGDGGIAREVLRHAVEAVRLVEIDRTVVDLVRKVLAGVPDGAFEDPRLALTLADGAAFVRDTHERYDVAIVDSPDPVGPGAALFTEAFYRDVRCVLRPGGLVVTQSGMPFLTPDWFAAHARTLAGAFGPVAFFHSTVPSYTGGPMAHALANPDARPLASPHAVGEHAARLGLTTRCWNPALHRAAFALPTYVADLAGPAGQTEWM